MKVSVIIPALNEADRIVDTIGSVQGQTPPFELIVVDGGSDDETVALASRSATVFRSPPGRARQMNAGSAAASGDVLLFLHADTRLPDGALDAVRTALADPDVVGGCFRLEFDRSSPLLRLYEAVTRLRWHRIAFGDRALFTRRTAAATPPFADMPAFEDLDFVSRLRKRGRLAYLSLATCTAARRFEDRGALRQQLRNLLLWSGYHLGVPPDTLARFYPYPAPQHGPAARESGIRP